MKRQKAKLRQQQRQHFVRIGLFLLTQPVHAASAKRQIFLQLRQKLATFGS